MPRFEFTRLTDEGLRYLLTHPLAFVIFAAALIGLALWLFVRGSHEDRDERDDGLDTLPHEYAPRSFSAPAKKGLSRPTVVRMRDRRKGAA